MFPELVKVVLIECEDITKCSENSICVKTTTNPLGIPVWKMFSLHCWNGACHPPGGSWTLSPEDYRSGNQYLGYSMKSGCLMKAFVPHKRRLDQVYILAKWLRYFYMELYA
ncbi:hypothetical protein CALVIDRAFT_376436 [Calocera viscosa TUFC12733]|uniref:Uncharacterized protein n=1 Tax=Calocera viscosa (strain TUFC12733) TaxID=1330018 RepID=A0A167GR22_CALVF|nr:hypothetical protein CALVIDRAFT_376436 [Calocera viscosa TUFC12733]